jgi:hypothetical protein
MVTQMPSNNYKLEAGQYALAVREREIKGQMVKLGRIVPPGTRILQGVGVVHWLGTEQELRDWAAANGIEVK